MIFVTIVGDLWRKSLLVCFAVLLSTGFCAGSLHAGSKELIIVTSVPPHAFIVEQLLADEAKVISLVDQGSDPHTYEPTPKQMLAISKAVIYFAGGLAFERHLLGKIRSINKELVIVNLAPSVGLSHGHEDQHSWLSPILYGQQVDTVFEALLEYLPEQKDKLTIRNDTFKERLSKTERQLRKLLEPYRGRVFYVFHPAFGHFGEAYGLHQEAVEVGRKRPTARQLQAIIKRSKADMVTTIFSQPQFDQRGVVVVANAIGGKIKILDPLEKDVLKNYYLIAESFIESFQ